MDVGIDAAGVRRSFGAVQAVADVTFAAAPGRVTGLVGPNGSGKTTLMLMLASLLRPDAGEMRIGGVDPVADAVVTLTADDHVRADVTAAAVAEVLAAVR